MVARAWLRPAGVTDTRRYAIYGAALIIAAAGLAAAALAHRSWVMAVWATAMAVLTAVSMTGKMRRGSQDPPATSSTPPSADPHH
jgi:hypothetical protein